MVRVYSPGERVQGYTIDELITTGNNSVAYAARSSAGEKVFFKLYQSPSIRVPWYRPFVQHQRELKQRIEGGPCRQFCYRFLGGFEYDRKYHQVFEFLDRSHSLAQILDRIRFSPAAVGWEQRELMAKVLVAGINQLHRAKIVHSDLKPDNVMLIEDSSIGMKYRLKIIDMDFSIFTDKTAPWDGHEGYFGTPGYMSPEHVTRRVPRPASDVFTLGLMLYQFLAQGHPYVFDDAEKYLPAYRAHSAPRPRLVGTPRAPATAASIEDALFRCLDPDPTRRPTAAELHKALTGDAAPGSGVVPADDAHRRADEERRREVERVTEELRRREAEEAEKRRRDEAARLPERIVLAAPGGVEMSLGARLVLGRVVLARFGAGAQYASDAQFVVERNGEGWFVEPCAGTPNDTLVNGERLSSRRKLAAGDVIAVGKAASGKTVLELTVRGG
jgi:serine/threonine protein kinase